MSENFYEYSRCLERDGRNIAELIQLFPITRGKFNLENKYEDILNKLYKNTITIMDKKIQEGEQLSDEEKKIYNTCKQQLQLPKSDGIIRNICWGVIGRLISAYETIYHTLPAGKNDAIAQKFLQKKR